MDDAQAHQRSERVGEAPIPDPDYRFTLANERTFLAWIRTSLGLLAAAVAIIQFAPDLGSELFRRASGLALAGLATLISAGALVRWILMQRAITEGRHLRRGLLPILLAVGLGVVALAVVIVLGLEFSS